MAIYADGSATVDATAAQARSITAMPHGYIRNCDNTCLRLQSLSGKRVYAVLPPPHALPGFASQCTVHRPIVRRIELLLHRL